ncbi:MAG: FAD-binding protein [Synergistaceae bacterium]|nr:FAD-binding protein [Synergistaceae bacterium]
MGTGAAGSAAASTACSYGASVVMVEKASSIGGTTIKSGGSPWIPNNFALRDQGIKDKKEECLKFLARANYPQLYNPEDARFGLQPDEYDLLVAYYDNGYKAIDFFMEKDICQFVQWLPLVSDYVDHVPENKVLRGRALGAAKKEGGMGAGADLIRQFSTWIKEKGIEVLLNHQVQRILLNEKGEAIGIEATTKDGGIRHIRGKKAVIFGSGGYTHNPGLMLNFQKGPTFGGCAVPTNTGDLVCMGQTIGTQLANMNGAWNAQIPLEQALENPSTPDDIWQPIGDSMMIVNKYGKRVVNEKRNYNDRSKIHFYWDPVEQEYLNQVLCMIYDRRTAEAFGDSFSTYPLPSSGLPEKYVISGKNWNELAKNIRKRVSELVPRLGCWRLDDSFEENLKETIKRFNGFAKGGVDEDFHRGNFPYDVEWHSNFFSVPAKDGKWPVNDLPNITMHPFTDEGPYYCILLAAGTLDTNGGPKIDTKARMLDTENKPIPGLYGAGNCIAAPMPSYVSGGATIGNALTFGYVAGMNAVKEPER